MTIRPHGITRLGYVRFALDVVDLIGVTAFYRGVLGLIEDERSTADRLYLRCWHEAYPYSLVIERSDSRRLIEIGFEVADPRDLSSLIERCKGSGVSVFASKSQSPMPGIGPSFVCEIPGGVNIRLFAATTRAPAYLTGHLSPNWVTPRDLRATTAPLSLNHVGITVPDPAITTAWLKEVLDFVVSEAIASDDGQQLLSALLFRMSKDVGGQEIALFSGPQGRLHHVAFTKEDANDILIDGQFLAEAGARIDPFGPTRQSYGKTFSLYFYDPFGVRLELCSGGRFTEPHPEFEPVVWNESNLLKALSFYDTSISPGFLDACV